MIIFFPFAFSATCTAELDGLRDTQDSYAEHVEVLAISVDSKFALRAYAEQRGYRFALLSDFWPHGAAAQKYRVFDDTRGMAVRGTFLVDQARVIRFAEANEPGEIRDQSGWRSAAASILADSVRWADTIRHDR